MPGLSSLEALIIVKKRGARVTFGTSATIVEVLKPVSEDKDLVSFVEVGRGSSLMEAVQEAARKEGWLA